MYIVTAQSPDSIFEPWPLDHAAIQHVFASRDEKSKAHHLSDRKWLPPLSPSLAHTSCIIHQLDKPKKVCICDSDALVETAT